MNWTILVHLDAKVRIRKEEDINWPQRDDVVSDIGVRCEPTWRLQAVGTSAIGRASAKGVKNLHIHFILLETEWTSHSQRYINVYYKLTIEAENKRNLYLIFVRSKNVHVVNDTVYCEHTQVEGDISYEEKVWWPVVCIIWVVIVCCASRDMVIQNKDKAFLNFWGKQILPSPKWPFRTIDFVDMPACSKVETTISFSRDESEWTIKNCKCIMITSMVKEDLCRMGQWTEAEASRRIHIFQNNIRRRVQ